MIAFGRTDGMRPKGHKLAKGPISVQSYARRTRRRLLTDMQHLQTLERRVRCRKKRTPEHNTNSDRCCPWPGFMQGCIGGRTLGVRTNEGVHTGKICVKSREFT